MASIDSGTLPGIGRIAAPTVAATSAPDTAHRSSSLTKRSLCSPSLSNRKASCGENNCSAWFDSLPTPHTHVFVDQLQFLRSRAILLGTAKQRNVLSSNAAYETSNCIQVKWLLLLRSSSPIRAVCSIQIVHVGEFDAEPARRPMSSVNMEILNSDR